MRDAFVVKLAECAVVDENIFLLSGDMGYKYLDPFALSFPDRFLNMGIAEANMIGFAAGLAHCDKKAFVFTIVPFLTMRAFEQIRVDICISALAVHLVGVGGGFSYGYLGPTHHSIEDIALMRALPNMHVIVPCDPVESQLATQAVINLNKPSYIRLGRGKEPVLLGAVQNFEIGRGVILRQGKDATLIACGPILQQIILAADMLMQQGIACSVINMHTIKPLDIALITEYAEKTPIMLTLEEHSIIGGLGSAVAECIAQLNCKPRLKIMGVQDVYTHEVGSPEHLLKFHQLTAEFVVENIQLLVNELKK